MKNRYSNIEKSASFVSRLKLVGLKMKMLIVLATFGFAFSGNSQQVIYNVGLNGLVNQNSTCGSSGYYNGCSGSYGVTWTSTNTGTPTSVSVQFFTGVNCGGAGIRTKSLNGVNNGNFSIPTGAGCFCSGTGTYVSTNLNPANYNSGGTNTFIISGVPSCEGFDTGLGGSTYARIVVQYAPNPCNSISTINCDTPTNFNIPSGSGSFNGNGPFSTPGREKIYSFTAPITGTYDLNVIHPSSYYVDLFFKTGGCSPSGWTYLNDVFSNETTSVNLTGGVTYLFLLDDENTAGSAGTFTIGCPDPCAVAASSNAPPILCNGGTTQVTVTGANGSAPYSGAGIFTRPAGTYTFNITDANGCPASTTITLTQPSVLNASASASTIACNGGLSTVTVSASGGTPGYSGTGTFLRPAGTHTFTVTDANGCTDNVTVNIGQPSSVNAVASATPIACNGGLSTVTVSGSGGTPGYSGTGTFLRPAGTHTFTVTDANGCTDNVTINISQPSAVVASANATPIACNGDLSTVTVSASGGTPGYSGTGTFSAPAGNHTYTVTDANGCSSNVSITIGEPSQMSLSISSTQIACSGGTSVVSVAASGGTAPYSGTGNFTVAAGTHTFTVTDANGCVGTISITVSEPTQLVASATAAVIPCIGGTTDVTVTATGGTPPYSGNGVYNVSAGTYTYTVTDANGCTSDAIVTVSENDNIPPNAVCQNLVIDLDANGNASITANDVDNGSSDACGIASLSISQSVFDCTDVGDNTVTLTVVDNGGNSSTCTSTVTVNDNVAPNAVCQDLVIDLDAAGNASITATDVDNGSSDACGIASLLISQSSFDCSNVGDNTVTLTVVDNNGNTSTCTSTVTVNDNVAPNAVCQDLIIDLDAAGNASITANDVDNGSSDACGIASLSISQSSFDCSNVGDNTVTLTVVDNNGNTSTCTSTVTVNDNVSPNAVCQDLIIDLDATGNASITANDVDNGSSDACGITSLSISQSSFDCSSVGDNAVTLTVVDNNGNTSTCTSTVTVNDNVAPNAVCQDLIIDLDATGNASITANDVDNGSSDACGITSLSISQSSFDCSNVGDNTVTLTVVDNNGNTSTCTSTVTVNDNVAPNAVCQNLVIDLDANGNASITANDVDNGSSDACGIASLSISQSSFDCSNVGDNTVTLTVVDNNGNTSTCTSTVTVNDNVAPNAVCQDLVIDLDANGNASITASNNVLANSSSDFSGTQGANGWTYGHYLAFDSNNFIPLSFSGFVWNNPGVGQAFDFPQLDANGGHPAETNLYWAVRRWTSSFSGNVNITGDFFDRNTSCGDGANVRIFKNGVQVYEYLNVPGSSVPYSIPLNVSAGDIIDFAIDPKFDFGCDDTHFTASVTSATGIDNGSSDACGIQSLSVSQSTFDCSNVGDNTVTLTVVDNNGNTSTCTSTVTVNDNVAPNAVCQDLNIDLDAAGNASITANDVDNGSSDACGIASLSISQGSFDCSNVGDNTVTLTVVDNNGNTSTCTSTVTVNDNVAPNAVCQDLIIDLDAAGNASITANDVDNGSSDACGIASLSISQSSFDCSNVGDNTVTLTVVDNNGNTSTCTSTVTVNDNVAPNAVCQDLVIDLDAAGNASITANDVDNGSSDACGIASLSISQSSFDCSNVGDNTVTLTVVDNNGNTSTCTSTVTVNDNVAPNAVCQDLVIDLDAAGNASITANDVDNGSSDACGIASLSISQGSFDCSNVGDNTVTLTVVDNNGNTSTCTSTVTVNDNVVPNAVCQDLIIDLDAAGNASITANDVDNGSSDACGIASLSISQSSFDCSSVGDNAVTLTVVDNNGNTSTCTSTVTVNDNVAPNAVCQDLVIDLDAAGNASITANDVDNGSSDACGIASLSISQSSFDCSSVGDNAVTLTVVDNNGNTSTCTSTVTVNDNVAPNAVCQDLVIDLDAAGNASITANDVDNGSSDACGIASLSIDQSGFDCSNVGDNTVTLTVVDNNGNTSTCTSTVTVNDNIAPNAVCQDLIIDLDAAGNASITANDVDNGSSDACGIASLSISQSSFDCSNVGDNTVTLTVVDNNGNTSTCTSTVTVNDNVAPNAACQDLNIDLDAAGNASITANDVDNGSSDACGIASLSISQSSFDCSNVGDNTVTLTVVDNNGNTSTCTSTVTVNDNVAPNAVCQDLVIDLDAAGNASITANDVDNGSSDACGIASLSISQGSFDCSNVGDNTVTLTVVDNNGNTSTCTSTVTVNDNIAPNAICQDIVVDLDLNGQASITAADIDNGSFDNCSIVSYIIVAGPSSFSCADVGQTYPVTLEVTDPSGNSSTCVAQVTVDGTPIVASASSTTILCFGGTTDITVTATGGFPPYSGIGTYTEVAGTYTYTVTDSKGCSSDVTITVGQPDQIEANITPQNHVIDCIPIPVTLTANPTGGTGGPYTYLWSTGETTASIEVNPNVTTTYTVEIWDANGCTVDTSSNGTTVTVINRCGNNNQKVVICHVPPGNSGNPQTLCISPNALNPHLSTLWDLHGGDYCGPCQESNALTLGTTNEGDNTFIRAGINSNNETIELSYRIGYDTPVRLEIYDMAGVLVEVVHTSFASEGELYEFKLNTTKISSGVYLYQFITDSEKHIDKLQIIQ